MKTTKLFYVLILLGLLLTACKGSSSGVAAGADAGDFANWNAWSITWKTAQTYDDVTVKIGDEQQTYLPEQENYVFVAIQAEILNISQQTEEMRFAQGPIYLTDQDQNIYDLVGIANKDTILMFPPYLLVDKTRFSTTRWDDGRFFTVAYQHEPQSWYIQATPAALFHVDFLFTIPRGASSGFVMRFGNGMTVNID